MFYIHVVNNLLHTTGQAMHIDYITFSMFSKHFLELIYDVNANVFQKRDYYLYKVCDVYQTISHAFYNSLK